MKIYAMQWHNDKGMKWHDNKGMKWQYMYKGNENVIRWD